MRRSLNERLFSKRLLFLKVDWSERCETSAGIAESMKPHRRAAPRRLSIRPRKASTLKRKSTPFLIKTTKFMKIA